MRPYLFNDDLVALKEDPDIHAVVLHTWRDPEVGPLSSTRSWLLHAGTRKAVLRETRDKGRPPCGYVVIQFSEPYAGQAIVRESDLVLEDRMLLVGDVVKRQLADSQSGCVISTGVQCILEPIYNNLPYSGADPWPHQPKDNRITVPQHELRLNDFSEGDTVVYDDKVGDVVDVFEEVTLRLGNGSVVRLTAPRDLEIDDPYQPEPANQPLPRLPALLKRTFPGAERTAHKLTQRHARMPLDFAHPGQEVYTSKATLRLGTWLIGSYTPSEVPRGIVLDVRTVCIHVQWIMSTAAAGVPNPPSEVIEGDALSRVRLYNHHGTPHGASQASIMTRTAQSQIHPGYVVRFRDVTAAEQSFSANSPLSTSQGVFRRVPREMTTGFDMNVFRVQATRTTAQVLWQDGSISEDSGLDLVPYTNVDDHDLWVGEICSLQASEIQEDGIIRPQDVGVVQSVNAHERTVHVRWYAEPKVSLLAEGPKMLLPESQLGPISDRESLVSLYEVITRPALNARHGDLVFVLPNHPDLGLVAGGANATDPSRTDANHASLTTLEIHRETDVSTTSEKRDQMGRPEVRWLGEVVDIGLDGLLKVRLGALDEIKDIQVSVEQVIVLNKEDDDDFDQDKVDDDDDSIFDDFEADSDLFLSDDEERRVLGKRQATAAPIAETIIYEGGSRLDNGDEENWTTDDDNDETGHSDHSVEAMDLDEDSTEKLPNSAFHPNDTSGDERTEPALVLAPKALEEYRFSKIPDMPEQFSILDAEPPPDHHYFSRTTPLSSKLLRRIHQEHNILSASLPQGIWVRTWSDRLDLLRILLIGPRGTPYELAPFVLDVHLPAEYPAQPPHVHFHSWDNGVGRINPNLYEDGTVCLSILGTWPENDRNEGWNAVRSSILQILVSLLGLVLVADPYYNEAGFESLVGSEDTKVQSRLYTEKALCMAKGFLEHTLAQPPSGLDDIVRWIYLDSNGPELLRLVVEESEALLQRSREPASTAETRLSAGAAMLLRPYLQKLQHRLPSTTDVPNRS